MYSLSNYDILSEDIEGGCKVKEQLGVLTFSLGSLHVLRRIDQLETRERIRNSTAASK